LIPGAFYLFLMGNMKESLILLSWAILVLAPSITSYVHVHIEGSRVHFLLVFLGVVGGINVWVSWNLPGSDGFIAVHILLGLLQEDLES